MVRARIEIHRDRVWLEIALAIVASACVAWVLLGRPRAVLGLDMNVFTLFPLSVGLGVWLPLLARTRSSVLGELRREGDALVIRGRLRTRRIALRRIRKVRVAPGARGASMALELDDGSVLAAALDDIEDARRLADEIRRDAPASDDVPAVSGRFGLAASILRAAASLFALAYYLHVVERLIPGEKPIYGLGALFSGIALLVLHLVRHGRARPAAGTPPRIPWECSPALTAHLQIHARAPGTTEAPSPPRPRLTEHGEPLGAWLGRLRRELGSPEAYRGREGGLWARLEHAYRSEEVPLRERALALRILAAGQEGEVRRRIAEVESMPAEDREWLTAVALAEEDEGALARVARRPPDFVA